MDKRKSVLSKTYMFYTFAENGNRVTPDPNCPLLSGDLGGMLATTCEILKLIFDFKLEENSRASKNCKLPLCLAFDHAGYQIHRDQMFWLGAIELG